VDRRLQRHRRRRRLGPGGDEGQERGHPDADRRGAGRRDPLLAADRRRQQSYDTAAKVNSGELDGQKAFTQGKVKIKGKMMKMMQLRGPLAELQRALDTIETEY
jgi:hypothetical protein